MSRPIALTGPGAAALLELDGFREQIWPEMWCTPIGGDSGERIVRTRAWQEPNYHGDVPVAPIGLILRHLNLVPTDLLGRPDGIAPLDRVELAVEHALRDGGEIYPTQGGRGSGDIMLHRVLRQRGDQPPTESYAETRAVQLFRTWGIVPWRQIPVRAGRGRNHRADFMIPFKPAVQSRRPEVITSRLGLLVEVDSREFHAEEFEHDSRRNTAYDQLGYHWVGITPNQIEYQPAAVRTALEGAFRRAGRRPPF